MNILDNDPSRGNDSGGEWLAMGEQWREQSVTCVDVDALRRESRARGRRIRVALALDLLATLVGTAFATWVLFKPAESMAAKVMMVMMIAFVLPFQAWSLWLRRDQLGRNDLAAPSLVALEIARARTSIVYWRWGVWISVAMGVLMTPVWMGVFGEMPAAKAAALVRAQLLLGGGVTLAMAVFACWWTARARARIARLGSIQDELGDTASESMEGAG